MVRTAAVQELDRQLLGRGDAETAGMLGQLNSFAGYKSRFVGNSRALAHGRAVFGQFPRELISRFGLEPLAAARGDAHRGGLGVARGLQI